MYRKLIVLVFAVVSMFAAWADYWMTFCKTPGGQQYSQVGHVRPDADGFVTIKTGPTTGICRSASPWGFVTIKTGPTTVVVYKAQVWYQKMSGEAPKMP